MDFTGAYLIFAAINNLNLNSFTMKVKAFFRLSAFLLLLYGCTDTWEELTREEKRRQESAAFSFEEAHTFFEEVMEHIPVTRSSQALQSDGVNFPTGEFTVRWEDARQVQRGDIVFFDIPIETQMRYTAYQEVAYNDSLYYYQPVPMYQRLMVMRHTALQQDACYITTFIPDSDELGMSDCVKCMQDDTSGRYSGLVLYLDLYNFRPVRVDRYKDGKWSAGVFLSGEVDDALDKVNYARSLMGNVRISQRMVTTRLGSDEGVPGLKGGRYTYIGNGFWMYYGKDSHGRNVEYLTIDWNEDGKPDALCLDEVVVVGETKPEPVNEEPFFPPSIRPTHPDTPRQDNPSINPYPSPDDGGWSSGPYPPPPTYEPMPKTLPPVKLVFPKEKYLGYVDPGRDCMAVCKDMLTKMSGNWSEVERYQLYVENPDGSLKLVGDPKKAFNMLNESLNERMPILVGLNYKSRYKGNLDQTTDHFVVILGRGYDEAKQQYYYIYAETGLGEKYVDRVFNDKNRLYYNPEKGTFRGKHQVDPRLTYDIVQIRPLKKK